MNDEINFVLDDDIPIMRFIQALASEGLTIKKIGGHAFRVLRHNPNEAVRSNVVDLMGRRLRLGMHAVTNEPPSETA